MVEYDPQEREVLKKIDFYVIPLLTLSMLSYFNDRSLVGQTRIARLTPLSGLEIESGFIGNQFDMAQLGYALGFLITTLPLTLILRRFGPATVLSGLTLLCGLLTLCTASSLNIGGYTVLRLLTGVSQSAIVSGTLVYMIYFYTRHEIATRLSIVFCTALMLQSFGSVVAHWILQENPYGLPSWKILYLLQGSWSMILGGIIALRLPNYPETAPWLSPADRSLAIARGRDGETHESSSSNQQFLTGSLPPPLIIIDGYGLSGPLRDPALWLLTLAFYLAWVPLDALLSLGTQICASSFNLSPGLISSMSSGNGTTSLITTLAVTNGGIGSSLWGTLDGRVSASFLAFLPFLGGLPLSVYLSHRTDERGSRVHMASAGLLLASIGSLFLALIPPLAPGGGPARYLFGYVPSILGLVIGLPILLAQSLDGVSGDCARCVRAACVTGFGLCASSTLWPALLFPLQASPGYALGHLLHSIMCIGCIISLQSLRRWFKSGSGLDEPLWTVPPGLTRLLNDVEEGKAWETVELKTTQIKRTVQEAVLGRKLEEPAPVSVAEAPRVVSPSVPVAVEDHPSSFQPIDNDDDDEEGFTNVY